MDTRAVWASDKGTFLRVIVKPNSKEKELIAGRDENSISVNLTSPAQEGKANIELVKRLSKLFKISTSSIRLVAGHKSREKILLIDVLSIEEIELKLGQ
jgi:uncharacterized protein (TIGR00251 family)